MLTNKLPLLLFLVSFVLAAPAAHAAPPSTDPTPPLSQPHISQAEAIAIRRQVAAGPAALAHERAAARAAGIPLDPKQLQSPLPPPDQNAAPLYQKLTQMLTQQPMDLPAYAEPLRSGVAYTSEQIETVRRILADRQDVLDLIDQATARPQCVFTRDRSQVYIHGMPEYGKMREAARLLSTQSYLLARSGHYAEAIEKQSLGFHLAEHAASDPILYGHLVGVAIEAITLAGLQDILELAGLNQDVASRVQETVRVHHTHLSLRYAIYGEIVQDMTLIDLLRRKGLDALDEVISPGSTPKPSTEDAWRNTTPRNHRIYNMMMDAEAAIIIHRMRPIFAAFNQPRPVRQRVFKQAEKTWASEHNNPLNVVADITSPVFSKADNKDTDLQAREQVTVAGAAVLAEKARTGAFPDVLPGSFPDPFTGKPLGYQREGDGGFIVYSVGKDGMFDGGKQGQYKFTPAQAFFRYPGPTPQPVPQDMLK